MKIGFFDSGLGGLTIFRKAIKNVDAEFYYLADNKNTPYGIKEKNVVKEYIFENVQKLVNIGCKIIVIACNTATSIAINELREKYKDICFIGTEPAVKVAYDDINSKKVFVFATTITTKEEKLKHLIEGLKIENRVSLIPLDKLVKFAEEKECNLCEVKDYVEECIKGYNLSEYTHIVLGCTHFPIFYSVFREIFGDNVKILDSSDGIVNNLRNKVNAMDEKKSEFKINILITKDSNTFLENAKKLLKTDVFNYQVI